MITFFRRIRKALLETGAISKYLLYAIGEILLVVIGILIALQINNWNEDRKTLKIRNNYIQNLLEDLASDTSNINTLINYSERGREEINKYFDYFGSSDKNISTAELLDSARQASRRAGMKRYFPVNNTFQEMQASGNLKVLTEEQRDAMIAVKHKQDYYQARIEASISNWLDRWQQVNNHLPVTEKGKSYFDERHVLSQRDLEMGLFHFHHVLKYNLNHLGVLGNIGFQLKRQTEEAIQLLQNK